MPVIVVDDDQKLQALINTIQNRPTQQNFVFLDLEGINLGRNGSIAIIQVLLPPNPTVYFVDVHTLQNKAFETSNDDGHTFQSILESPDIPKVLFDVRNDSDALFSLFQIKLQCLVDLQILEYATRESRGKHVKGLATCVQTESLRLELFSNDWNKIKEEGRKLFAPEKGGRYEVFNERPLPKALVDYCEQDVLLMPGLLRLYAKRLIPGWAKQLQAIFDARITLSQSLTFNGKGQHMAVGPVLKPAR